MAEAFTVRLLGPIEVVGPRGVAELVGARQRSLVALLALRPGKAMQALMMRGTPALVRDLYVAGGETVVVSLRPSSGDADLAVVASTSDTWLVSRSQAVQTSTQPGLTEERVTVSVPAGLPGRTFGVVVINNTSLTEAVLARH